MKKIYSLNQIAYLKSKQYEEISFECDEFNHFYAVFPENKEIAEAIREYKENIQLKEFLNCFTQLKRKIKELRKAQ